MSALHLAHHQQTVPQARHAVDWKLHLPREWRDQVVVALDFIEHREYEMVASRCFGYDEDDSLCYYAHRFLLDALGSDDDEEFYSVVTYGEMVIGWRMRDDRWLIYRVVHSSEEGGSGRGFYSFAEQAPR
ncbi:MAG: hypothetical protein RIR18_1966 [Pseudomonadota bacterium]|jgi:hypothetical protein